MLLTAMLVVEHLRVACRVSASRRWMTMQMGQPEPEYKPGEALQKFTRDLTAEAAEGKMDPIIGRSQEIERAIQILSRRIKHNVMFIGDAGVGKTACVEGLAQRIASGDVPESIKGKRLLSLDLTGIMAGTQFRGDFERHMKALLRDVKEARGDAILFADEAHQLMGMGAAGSPMGADNILKPALARGDLKMIGATTLAEYRKHMETDLALVRRFQNVFVSEPTVDETVALLRGLKEKYEIHHGTRIMDEAVVASAAYSDRYITDRKLPDKALDTLDEAASRVRMRRESKPKELADIESELLTLKIEREALRKETDVMSKERLSSVEGKISKLQVQCNNGLQEWRGEKDRRAQAKEAKSKLEAGRTKYELAIQRGDYATAGELKYSTIPDLEATVSKLSPLLQSGAVSRDDVASVISSQTGIQMSRLLKSERDRLMHVEDALRKRVVGQDSALSVIGDALRVSRSGLRAANRPVATFLLLGPSGTGKTETARALAEFLFDDETAMVRIDMSELSERHSGSRLIGAPPGYIGYDQGGQLTEPIRRRPYQIVLLDEIEKASREVTNVLLQVLDDGQLTDGSGRRVDFRNTIVMMTSNLGSDRLDHNARASREEGDVDPHIIEQEKEAALEAVRAHFPPEFINRLDDVVLYNSLTRRAMGPITDIQLKSLIDRVWIEHRIRVIVGEDARSFIANTGFDPHYGARPLKRAVHRELLAPFAKLILSGGANPNDFVRVEVDQTHKRLAFHVTTGHSDELVTASSDHLLLRSTS